MARSLTFITTLATVYTEEDEIEILVVIKTFAVYQKEHSMIHTCRFHHYLWNTIRHLVHKKCKDGVEETNLYESRFFSMGFYFSL
jgi:hypothetical protein